MLKVNSCCKSIGGGTLRGEYAMIPLHKWIITAMLGGVMVWDNSVFCLLSFK